MIKHGIISVLFFSLTAINIASAQEPKEMSSLDYALGDASLVGQTLKLTGCRISHVSIQSGLCNINVGDAGAGNIVLDTETMDKTELKQAILKCAGLKGFQSEECDASIIGIAKKKTSKPNFQVKKIIWNVEK